MYQCRPVDAVETPPKEDEDFLVRLDLEADAAEEARDEPREKDSLGRGCGVRTPLREPTLKSASTHAARLPLRSRRQLGRVCKGV